MKSPCVKVCQMDPGSGCCLGCARTLEEIARWGELLIQRESGARIGEEPAGGGAPIVAEGPLGVELGAAG